MTEHDPASGHDELSDELESGAEKMKERSASLGQEIGDVRDDWHRKQEDQGTPGAEPAKDPFEEEPSDEEQPHSDEEQTSSSSSSSEKEDSEER